MPPTANKPPPSQPAGRPKNARAAVVPVIPLPLVQKQQQQRQQKLQEQQRLKQQQLDLEKKQKEEHEKKEQELKKQQEEEEKQKQKQKQKENKPMQEATNEPEKDTDSLNGDDNHKTVKSPAVVSTPVDKPTQLASTSTPQTVVDASTSVSSPTTSKTPQSSTNATLADPTAAPFVPPTTSTFDRPSQSSGPVVSGASQPHIAAAGPSSAGLPSNGHAVPDFVFPPHSRSGSAARQRPLRHTPQLPPHPQHPLHSQHHAHGFHQPHPSASSITFGAFHDSNNVSPVPTGHGPLPPPPGLIAGPQFVPYNMQNMGPVEWQGPPGVPLSGDVNGFAPPSAGFNPSTPGSFHGSHSPDNVTDGSTFQHRGGAMQPGGPNGHLPLRNNDSMSSMMSPPFFQPSGFHNAGPHERHGGRDEVPNRGFDFQFVHHLQQQLQHSLDNPQTSDCHLIVHVPKANANSNNITEPNGPEQQQQEVYTAMFAGHRNVLFQSQSVGHLLRSDAGTVVSGPFNQPILALHMKIEDPYITVEAAVQALRSLYGHPLADVQSLDKALANLTAGFVFMLDHVESVGAEQASRLVGWDTIEKVLAYVLNGASFPNTADGNTNPNGPAYAHAELRYGRGAGLAVRLLLSQAVDFVVRNFPTAFALNTAAANSASALSTLIRFPVDTAKATPASQAADDNSSKATSNGTSAHLRSAGSVSLPVNSKKGGPRSPKIVFGGFAEESAKAGHNSINGVLNTADNNNGQTDVASILSRILVNLPYDYLKYVLGHPQLTADRVSITRTVIEERERRRLQALDAIHAGTVLNNSDQRDAILARLQRPTPPRHRDHPVAIDGWDVLGWKEFTHGETGELVRVWAHADASR